MYNCAFKCDRCFFPFNNKFCYIMKNHCVKRNNIVLFYTQCTLYHSCSSIWHDSKNGLDTLFLLYYNSPTCHLLKCWSQVVPMREFDVIACGFYGNSVHFGKVKSVEHMNNNWNKHLCLILWLSWTFYVLVFNTELLAHCACNSTIYPLPPLFLPIDITSLCHCGSCNRFRDVDTKLLWCGKIGIATKHSWRFCWHQDVVTMIMITD